MGQRSDAHTCRIEFVGGPWDGQRETVPSPPAPTFIIAIYRPLPMSFAANNDFDPADTEVPYSVGRYNLRKWFRTGEWCYSWDGEIEA